VACLAYMQQRRLAFTQPVIILLGACFFCDVMHVLLSEHGV
jgi:hypothetical protein